MNEMLRISMNLPGFAGPLMIGMTPGVTVLTGINNVGKSRIFQLIVELAGSWGRNMPFDNWGPTTVKIQGANIIETLTIAPDNSRAFLRFSRRENDANVAEIVVDHSGSSWTRTDPVHSPPIRGESGAAHRLTCRP